MSAISFKNNPEYSDIKPLKQDDEDRNVFRIAYTEQFIECHDYLRALMATDERSLRALAVTKKALELNPANYTTWHYRRNIITSISYDLVEEGKFITYMVCNNIKNYQVWFHRQWWLEGMLKKETNKKSIDELVSAELDFIKDIFDEDSKNYHTWQYLRWICNEVKIPPDTQLELIDGQLLIDPFNNSAWNHRFYTVVKDEKLTPDIYKREFDNVTKRLKNPSMMNNESAWHYLYGILKVSKTFTKPSPKELLSEAFDFAQSLSSSGDITIPAPVLSFLVEVCFELMALDYDRRQSLRSKILVLCDKLANEVDVIRKNYWNYRKRQLESIEID